MKEIIFIASVHDEIGASNPTELVKIFESISPDVIFIEFDMEHYKDFLSGHYRDKLEISAIKLYLAKQTVNVVPVDFDWYPIMEALKNEGFDDVHNIFYRNTEFRRASYYFKEQSFFGGFNFLNCDYCMEHFDYKHFLEHGILKYLGNEHLTRLYDRYMKMHYDREMEMLTNIYNYSLIEKYEKAIFLIGTEHKSSIISKIPEFEAKYKVELNWNFNFFNF